jgi:hypothetical protein
MIFAFLPKALTRSIGGDANESWHLNVVLSHSMLLVLVFFSPALASMSGLGQICLFRYLADIPCPGCGVTSSVVAISKGDIARAVKTNPAGVVVVAGIAAQAFFHGMAVCWPKQERGVARLSTGLAWCVLGCLVLVWLWRLSVCCL